MNLSQRIEGAARTTALIVLAHPEPSSFNSHWAGITARSLEAQRSTVIWSNLYEMQFDPVERAAQFKHRADAHRFDVQREQQYAYESGSLPADVAAEISKILKADLVVFHFPLWWFGMPAILKGWMDRVFVYEGMYKGTRRYDQGLCQGKRAMFCVTTGSSARACSYKGYEGDTQLILWPAMYPLRYLGFTVIQPFIIYGVHDRHEGAQEAYRRYLNERLQSYGQLLESLDCAPVVPYNRDCDFDEAGCLKPEAPVYSPFTRQLEKWQMITQLQERPEPYRC